MSCAFCGLDNYLGDEDHPCCLQAKRRGEDSCFGCESFKRRWERGRTCPHVSGPERACCSPKAARR